MSLQATIKSGATAIAPTGGTDITLSAMGIQNGIASTFVSQDTSMLTRRSIDFSSKDPKANAASPGGMTQARRKVVLHCPRTITAGASQVITQDKVTIELSFDVNATLAQVNDLRYLAAQLVADGDFDNFYQAGSLA